MKIRTIAKRILWTAVLLLLCCGICCAEVAEETDIDFADLSEIRGKKEYQSEAGIAFLLSNGKTETVSEEAATHPGDSGMAYIADRGIEKIAVK